MQTGNAAKVRHLDPEHEPDLTCLLAHNTLSNMTYSVPAIAQAERQWGEAIRSYEHGLRIVPSHATLGSSKSQMLRVVGVRCKLI